MLCAEFGTLAARCIPHFRVTVGGVSCALAVLYTFAALRVIRLRPPTRHWQVPRRWAVYGTPRFELLFGLALGAGVLTVTPFIETYLLLLVCLVLGSAPKAALIMGAFGLARFAPLALVRALAEMRRGQRREGAIQDALDALSKVVNGLSCLRAALLLMLAASTAGLLLRGLA